ncbi:bifunctional glycosyltransferase family 2/GtrA family protein [Actinocorallia sp. API 0066]|uniref:bifunctional glycosyltransferase family 2/GtrA family protein n=1 Tax=Actinocorallia sp. API 0066 TaxID=2896846 RepID=UPI001E2DD064|nr:bifunctional glycosyltransferase family 2/GtrA family protein [Actinocorallia sp. API 0066]MCD0450747.1 bifunctional glycosyltransferase family 2/GtrA family protein [Actinocorallia sp. API 0066]
MSTTTDLPGAPSDTAETRRLAKLVEIVVPVHNEEHVLEASVRRLHGYLTATFPYAFRIIIADNASTDRTSDVAGRLAEELPHVRALRLDRKGRGLALRHVWGASDADVVAYMDVDLSTRLEGFLPLVAPLLSGHSDLAIGSRLTRQATVVRGAKREFVSRCYNLLLRATLAARFSDAQCGFKAARAEVAQALLPQVEDDAWFFDTELLLLAQRTGLRIHEVPVDWVDDPDSRVDVARTALDDLRGMARVARRIARGDFRAAGARRAVADLPDGMARRLPRFALVGIVCTVAQAVLYVALRTVLLPFVANALSLLLTAVANTALNRRFTFGVTGGGGAVRHQLQGGTAFLVGLCLSTGALALLHGLAERPSRALELVVVVAANGLATLVRFLLLRGWVFRARVPKEALR